MIRSEPLEDGPVTVVVIDRPDRRNALSLAGCHELTDAVAAAVSRRDRAIVLRGSAGHFCSGADLDTVDGTEFVAALRGAIRALTSAPLAAVAAVEGVCFGAGLQLALACDLVVAAPTARFAVPAARLGLMVDQATAQRLSRVVGPGRAAALLLAADELDAPEALTSGLAQRSGTPEEAVDWARRIADLAPLTVAGHKLALRTVDPPPAADEAVAAAFEAAWASADKAEGMSAYAERRRPRFEGR